jgi:hypothetical protein
MSLSHSPKIVTNGLVLCLDAADKKSYPGTGTLWTDRSGNGNNGTLVNGPTFNSSNGGSIVFDGVDDYASTPPSNLYQTNTITCSCWVKIITLNSFNYFLANYTGGFDGWIMNYDGRFRVDGRINGNPYQSFATSNNFPINNWYNVVFVRNNQFSYIFVNSILSGSFTWLSSANYTNSNNLNVGAWTSVENSNSNVSQVLIYNRVLSTEEIKQNFNATRGRYGI